MLGGAGKEFDFQGQYEEKWRKIHRIVHFIKRCPFCYVFKNRTEKGTQNPTRTLLKPRRFNVPYLTCLVSFKQLNLAFQIREVRQMQNTSKGGLWESIQFPSRLSVCLREVSNAAICSLAFLTVTVKGKQILRFFSCTHAAHLTLQDSNDITKSGI